MKNSIQRKKLMPKKYSVWKGDNIDNEVFAGSKAACHKYYKKHGGSKNDLHIGYEIWNCEDKNN